MLSVASKMTLNPLSRSHSGQSIHISRSLWVPKLSTARLSHGFCRFHNAPPCFDLVASPNTSVSFSLPNKSLKPSHCLHHLHTLAQFPLHQSMTSSHTLPYPIERLMQAELQARQDKRICYNCDEFYMIMHKYATK